MHHDDGRCWPHQTVYPAFISQIFQCFPDPTGTQAYTCCQVAQSGTGRVSVRERGDQAGHHRPRSRSDFDIVSAPSNSSGIAQSQVSCDNRRWRRCGAACGPQRRPFVPMGGQIDFVFSDTSALPYVAAGKLRALGVTSAERFSVTPDLPTFQQLGLKDFVVTSWYAIVAPAGIPRKPSIVSMWRYRKRCGTRGFNSVSGMRDFGLRRIQVRTIFGTPFATTSENGRSSLPEIISKLSNLANANSTRRHGLPSMGRQASRSLFRKRREGGRRCFMR